METKKRAMIHCDIIFSVNGGDVLDAEDLKTIAWIDDEYAVSIRPKVEDVLRVHILNHPNSMLSRTLFIHWAFLIDEQTDCCLVIPPLGASHDALRKAYRVTVGHGISVESVSSWRAELLDIKYALDVNGFNVYSKDGKLAGSVLQCFFILEQMWGDRTIKIQSLPPLTTSTTLAKHREEARIPFIAYANCPLKW